MVKDKGTDFWEEIDKGVRKLFGEGSFVEKLVIVLCEALLRRKLLDFGRGLRLKLPNSRLRRGGLKC